MQRYSLLTQSAGSLEYARPKVHRAQQLDGHLGIGYRHRLHNGLKAWDGLWLLARTTCQASDL